MRGSRCGISRRTPAIRRRRRSRWRVEHNGDHGPGLPGCAGPNLHPGLEAVIPCRRRSHPEACVPSGTRGACERTSATHPDATASSVTRCPASVMPDFTTSLYRSPTVPSSGPERVVGGRVSARDDAEGRRDQSGGSEPECERQTDNFSSPVRQRVSQPWCGTLPWHTPSARWRLLPEQLTELLMNTQSATGRNGPNEPVAEACLRYGTESGTVALTRKWV